MESYRFLVSGKVQHVYYRKFVSQALMRKQVRGYVRNLSDGRVEAVVRLWEEDLDAVVEVLQKGSPSSEVDEIAVEVLDDDDLIYDGFEIRY
jgi:acylphosphatase